MITWLKSLFGSRTFGAMRSSEWPKVQKAFLTKYPYCTVCEAKWFLNVHHIKPVHLFPQEELKETNLITLCRVHHFLFGHLLSWRSYNLNVREDAYLWYNKIKHRL